MSVMPPSYEAVTALISYARRYDTQQLKGPLGLDPYYPDGKSAEEWWFDHLIYIHHAAYLERYPDEEENYPIKDLAEYYGTYTKDDIDYLNQSDIHCRTLSLVRWYVYQGDQYSDWDDQPAKLFTKQLQDLAINKLPNYIDHPWGYRLQPDSELPKPYTRTPTIQQRLEEQAAVSGIPPENLVLQYVHRALLPLPPSTQEN